MRKPYFRSQKEYDFWVERINREWDEQSDQFHKLCDNREANDADRLNALDNMISCAEMMALLDSDHKKFVLYDTAYKMKSLLKLLVNGMIRSFTKGA